MRKLILFLILNLFLLRAFAATQILNVYNWSNYMPDEVIAEFQKETGIKINYSTYDSNEALYAKLKAAPHAGYDVIIPSSYYVDRMRRQGMLQTIDKSQIPNFKNLNPQLLNRQFDPNNEYSIPYLWGTTGIAINSKYIKPGTITSWADFWQPQYKNELLMSDDVRETFAIAFIVLGYSINDTNPQHIQQAYLKLKQLLPNIKLFNSDAAQSIYIDEDVRVGMAWSGDIYTAKQENSALDYIYPRDGFGIWIDCVAIPKYAPHLQNAYRFLNFLMRPDIGAKIAGLGYSSPNLAAIKLLPPKLRDSKIAYPPADVIKRGQTQLDVGDATAIYEKYWELLKVGG